MTLVESILVIFIVAAAFAFSARYLFRAASGKSRKCAQGDSCPLVNACSCTPDAAQSGEAPDECPINSGEAHGHA